LKRCLHSTTEKLIMTYVKDKDNKNQKNILFKNNNKNVNDNIIKLTKITFFTMITVNFLSEINR